MKINLKHGFTLVEMSIVLVIIGLIVGSISLGQYLMNNARIRTVIKEFDNLYMAIQLFKEQYEALPGNFTRAGSFWTSATCANSAATAGCNGDGDHTIDWGTSVSGEEHYRVWQHLSLAGFIEGSFTGTNTKSDHYPSKFPNGFYDMRWMYPYSGFAHKNFLELGAWSGSSMDYALLTPNNAYNIDRKIDNGIANSGKIYGVDGMNVALSTCSYAWNTAGGLASYTLSNSNNTCRVQLLIE
jgi:prepilin-type N-terminal cleavage/methylation domain-containing protein